MSKRETLINNKDIKTSKQLSGYIRKIDSLIFPNQKTHIVVNRKKSTRRFKAMYTWPNKGDYYSIFTPGLHKHFEEDLELGLLFSIVEEKLVHIEGDIPIPSLDPLLVALASHEVRHRMQAHNKIKFLVQDLSPNQSSDLLKESMRYVGFVFNELKKTKFSKASVNKWELDAWTIQTMILHIYKTEDPLEKILPILSLGC